MKEAERSSSGFDLFELWKEYEKVAMHFNDLIIKLRSQSLAGVAAFATIVAVITKNETSLELRWGFLTGTFSVLAVYWIAVWLLDFGYYNRLLEGAVDALLEIESQSKHHKTLDQIELSTRIEKRVKSGNVGNYSYRLAFYVLVLSALIVGLAISAYHWRSAEAGIKTDQTTTGQMTPLR